MVNQLLAATLFVLTAFDAYATKRRISLFGAEFELNEGIKWLSKKIGPETASILGIMIPGCALIALGLIFQLNVMLSLLIGFRSRQAFIQAQSIAFEKEIRKYAATLKEAALSSGQHLSLPPGNSATSVESKPAPTSSKGE